MKIKSSIFPVLSLRVRAYLVDLLVLGFLVYVASFVVSFLGNVTGMLKGGVFMAVIVLFEPVLMRFTGGSLGHHYVGIKVVDVNTHENLGLFKGVLRVILKAVGGFFSLFGMLITRQHRSIHDALSGSVVLFKNDQTAPEWRKLKRREQYLKGEKSPLKRRLLVFVSYSVIIYVVLNWAAYAILSAECWLNDICNDVDGIKVTAIFIVIFVTIITLFVLAVKGKLYGSNFK